MEIGKIKRKNPYFESIYNENEKQIINNEKSIYGK
jgi:hypothetical protein